MSGPAVPILPWFSGPEPTTLTPGSGSGPTLWYPLIPTAEPASAGAPPIRPNLTAGLARGHPSRKVAVRAGYDALGPIDTAPRPTCRVTWGPLSKANRNTLLEWLRDDVVDGQFAMTIEVDGPGEGSVKLRPIAEPVDTHIGRQVYRIEVDCEEVFS